MANMRPELAAAEHADRRARAERSSLTADCSSRTLRFCSSRKALSFCAQRARLFGQNRNRQQRRVLRARRPDGQRRDRHTRGHLHDREQRIEPFSALLSTGTPSTGSVVCAAVMPGRCAAPPAPAMMTSMPAPFGARGKLGHQFRRAMRGDRRGIRARTPNSVSISLAARMVSQSDLLPMMMDTSGARAGAASSYWPCASVNPGLPSKVRSVSVLTISYPAADHSSDTEPTIWACVTASPPASKRQR